MTLGDRDLLRSARAYQREIVQICLNDVEGSCGSASKDAAPRTWFTYRRLVRARLRETVEHAFQRLQARLGSETFCELLHAFFHAVGPRSLLLRDVPREFLGFLTERIHNGECSDLPSWTLDLARFEWAELEVAYAEDDPSTPIESLSMSRPLAVSSACRALRVDHRVHELLREHPREPIRSGKTWICLYRDRVTFDVRVLELSESAAVLLEGAVSGNRSLAECAKDAALRTGATLDAAWLEAFASLLADLTERGIVLGSRGAIVEGP